MEEAIVIYATRYALGRKSYCVEDVCEYITARKNELSDSCKRVLIKDIEADIKLYHRLGMTCGMPCDEESWLKLLEVLKGE
jgi:hypothetical protein